MFGSLKDTLGTSSFVNLHQWLPRDRTSRQPPKCPRTQLIEHLKHHRVWLYAMVGVMRIGRISCSHNLGKVPDERREIPPKHRNRKEELCVEVVLPHFFNLILKWGNVMDVIFDKTQKSQPDVKQKFGELF